MASEALCIPMTDPRCKQGGSGSDFLALDQSWHGEQDISIVSLPMNSPRAIHDTENRSAAQQPSFLQPDLVPPPNIPTGRMAIFEAQCIKSINTLFKVLHWAGTWIYLNVKPRQILTFFFRFVLDNIILLQMGSTFRRRFRDFALASAEVDGLSMVDDWRKDQQEEWNRLSTTLALMGTMNSAILAITPRAPSLAFAVWLGGAGLSVCGIFVVQYFPIKAFSITDQDMGDLVKDDNDYVNITMLAIALASPVVITLWTALLFVIGIIDYILDSGLRGTKYQVIAALPVVLGIVVVVLTLVLGETIDQRVNKKYYVQS